MENIPGVQGERVQGAASLAMDTRWQPWVQKRGEELFKGYREETLLTSFPGQFLQDIVGF